MATDSSSPKLWGLSGGDIMRIECAVKAAQVDRTHIKIGVEGPDGNIYRLTVYRMLDLEKIAAERAKDTY